MRNIKIRVAYDGTDFAGWQRQKNALTVQQCIEEAAGKAMQQAITIIGAGRTDRGVHALGQVANFRTESAIPCERIPHALNFYLPQAIRVDAAWEVPDAFHACRDARGKHYRYTLWGHDVAPVLHRRYTAIHRHPLDRDAMLQAAEALKGEHDFKAFRTQAKGQAAQSTVKTVWDIRIRSRGHWIFFDVIGSGFLYNQVRTMAGTLVEVGRGRISADAMGNILASRARSSAGPTMPPQGLCLIQVFYGDIPGNWLENDGPII